VIQEAAWRDYFCNRSVVRTVGICLLQRVVSMIFMHQDRGSSIIRGQTTLIARILPMSLPPAQNCLASPTIERWCCNRPILLQAELTPSIRWSPQPFLHGYAQTAFRLQE
jgi:hypothetical protein